MTHRKLTATAAATLAIMGSMIAVTTGQAPARAASSCTPSWHLRAAPPAPGSDAMNPQPVAGGQDTAGAQPDLGAIQLVQADNIESISPISSSDVMFTGADNWPATAPWTLRWDGHSLATTPQAGEPASPSGVSVSSFDSDTDGWEVGNAMDAHGPASAPVVERWHSGRWTVTHTAVLDVGADGTSAGFGTVKSISPNNAWLAGAELLPGFGGTAGALIEHWDGTQWSVLPNPASARQQATLAALTVISANDIWAVGQQNDDSGNHVPLALHWNGTSWQEVQVPAGIGGVGVLTAVSAAGPSDVWAVGSQLQSASSNLAAPLAEHWDGKAWTVVSLPDHDNAELSSVYAAGPGDVWASGTFAEGLPSVFLHLDGAKGWSTVPTPGPAEFGLMYTFSQVNGTGPDDVWALGSTLNLGASTDSAIVAHLDCGTGGS